MNHREKTVRLTELAVLTAMIVLLEVTGLGMIRTFGMEMTILQVPVIIGAILLGPADGAILGACFGMVSFLECLGKSPFGFALFGINPFYAFLTCVPTRTLMGFLCGLIFQKTDRILGKTKAGIVPYLAASLGGALLNTVLFMGTLCACYYQTDYVQGFVMKLHAGNVFVFVILFVGLQGLLEALICAGLGTAISKTLRYTLHREK